MIKGWSLKVTGNGRDIAQIWISRSFQREIGT